MIRSKKIIKKFMICLTCCLLIFASCVKPAKAFALVDDLALALIIGGLCAAGGVVLSQDTIKDNVGQFLSDAVDVYSTYMSIPINQAKDALTTLCTGIYDTGSVLATDFNDWLQGWLGGFINTSVIPTYISTSIFPSISCIKGVSSISPTTVPLDFPNHYLAKEIGAYALYSNTHMFGFYGFGKPLEFWINSTTGALAFYSSSGVHTTDMTFQGREWYLAGSSQNYPNDLIDTQIFLTGLKDVIVHLGNGVKAYFIAGTGKWWADELGTLELDPGVFNEDMLGDIDIAPPWQDTYNNLTNSMDYTGHYVYGRDMTFDGDNTMDYPGTIVIPKDWDLPWTDTKDYPLVIPTDKPLDIPLDDVKDRYPDYVYPGTPDYTADWTRVFPFCIPFDIFKFLGLMSATPKAPHFVWNYNFMGNKGTVDINLNKFDDIAGICRTLFDLLFIVGLAMVTRNHMIKA